MFSRGPIVADFSHKRGTMMLKKGSHSHISFRTSQEGRERLDALSAQMGCSPSQVLRMLLETARIEEAAVLAPVGRLRERSQAQMSG